MNWNAHQTFEPMRKCLRHGCPKRFRADEPDYCSARCADLANDDNEATNNAEAGYQSANDAYENRG